MIPATAPVEFGEWMPDLGAFNNPGALVVTNCQSVGNVYKPWPAALENTPALPTGYAKGGFAYRDATGNVTVFGATNTNIYKLSSSGTWTDVTRTSGAYTGSTETFWKFVNFGNLVIATNYNDDIQVLDMGGSATNFSQLSTTAPRARGIFILENYLVCYDTVDGDGAVGYRVRWSPLANPQGNWNDLTTGADHQDIYGGDYSNTYGAALQDFGVIVQGKSLWRMDYVAGTDIFDFHIIDQGHGAILSRGCITNGRSIFMLDEGGFYEYDGESLTAIGDAKVDKTFYQMFNQTFDYNLNMAVDTVGKNVLWSFPDLTAVTGIPNQIMCFNWVTRRFTMINQVAELLFSYLSVGYTMDGLDAVDTNLDTLPFSLDSRYWTGGKTILGCFTTNNKLAAFNGLPLMATLGTPEVRLNQSGRATVHSIIPYIEGGSFTGQLAVRNTISDSPVLTTAVAQNTFTGEIDFLDDATFHRAQITISGAWSQAYSIAFRAKNTGAV